MDSSEVKEAPPEKHDAAVSETASDNNLYINPEAERKLLLKLDTWLAPVMTIIFLAAYLDRSNIGNAASAGMTTDLSMSSGELGNAVTLFYVTYVAFEVPCSLAMKKLRPSRMIPTLVFCWSIVIIGTGFIHTTGQMYASRLLLGLFESGMFPCLALYLSTFYAAREQALRISYLFVSAALSGAFGGLFAYALLKLDGHAGLAARFLTDADRQLLAARAEREKRYHGRPEFEWADVRKAFRDPKLYVSCWSQFWGDICSFGLSSFLPLIIKTFGFDAVTTQLLTIPVYFWASGLYLFVSWLSDRYQTRYFCMVPAVLITAVGYAINVSVPSTERAPLYFSLFLIAPGIYIILGLNCTWLLNTYAGYYKRATAVGMNQSIGNSAGVVVGQIFKTTVGGKYLLGLSFSLGSVLLAGLGHFVLYFFLKRQNQKREALTEEEREHEIQHGKGGDFHPDFRYAL